MDLSADKNVKFLFLSLNLFLSLQTVKTRQNLANLKAIAS